MKQARANHYPSAGAEARPAKVVAGLRAVSNETGAGNLDYAAVFDQFADNDTRGLLIVGPGRRVFSINAAGRAIFQFDGDTPAHISDVVRDVNVGFAVGEALHDRVPTRVEIYVPGPDRLLEVRVIPVLAETGEPVLAMASVEDVTRLRHLETVRRDFVANVSHELRTPLASINLLVETLQGGALEDHEAAQHFLSRIQVEALSMARLVEELLELSRLETGTMALNLEPVPISSLLRDVMNRLAPSARERRIAVTLDAQDDLAPVLIDPQRMEQVVLNLLHNAIKFTPEGGQVWLRARRHGPAIEVEVADTGVGMDPDVAARIFERFFKADQVRGREGGSGLGLAIVRHLLELHGSQLQVVSEPGRGSRFAFALPIARSAL